MRNDYIDFISSYCDRWCERCAFTARCSTYAADAAIAMCGDVAEGLELAVGRPAVPFAPPPEPPAWLAEIANVRPDPERTAAWEEEQRARRARVDANPVVKASWAVSMLAFQWLKAHSDRLRAGDDPVLVEALDVAAHDAFLVTVKLTRAVDGRDEYEHGGDGDEGPGQNDWNGSAKVALLCLDRSADAWRIIAQASNDEASREIAAQMDLLRRDVEQEFPSARAFIRPGFDELP